jgi:hypothetical protein
VALKPLSAVLDHAVAHVDGAHALATKASEFAHYRDLLLAVVPTSLISDITAVATKNQSLTITVRSHAAATKLYQFQQRVIAHFAAKGLNFKEIRVFVQTIYGGQTRPRVRPELPPEAVSPLMTAAERTQNSGLKTALLRLSSHAKTGVKH